MKILTIISVLFLLWLNGCKEEPPVTAEGNSRLELTAIWNASGDSTKPVYQPVKNAKVILSSPYGTEIKQTDENGRLILTGIPSATYTISVRGPHPDDSNILLVGNVSNIAVLSGKINTDTVIAQPISSTGIAINEIYACGPVNNTYYFYDQFIELYNASDSVKYLDGMIIMRFSGNSVDEGHKGTGADEYGTGSIYGVTYMYKFPGKPGEKNYPFPSKKFLVIAQKAIDHSKNISTSINLCNADWEFYNQYSTSDIDNYNVPNLVNMRSDVTVDFMMNLGDGVIILSSGVDSVWTDGIDISTIIDGVQYLSSSTYSKTLDDRVDKGKILGPSKYSGNSLQRREPGMDTNNGAVDWEVISHPTPGYQ